tara:strand:- start:10729 stop:11307 length:579 start_codon:yes stop_codon:yes gene_type:complete
MSIDINHIDTVLSICTDVEIKSSTIPEHVSERIFNCLVQGNVFLLSQKSIENKMFNETVLYQSALQDYEKILYRSAQNDMEKRHKLRSMQRNIVTLSIRLKHFSGLFNIPSFINLSDGRRLRKIEEYVSGLKDTYTYVSTLPPVLVDFKEQTENIASASVNIDEALVVRDREALRFQEAMTNLRNSIHALYV